MFFSSRLLALSWAFICFFLSILFLGLLGFHLLGLPSLALSFSPLALKGVSFRLVLQRRVASSLFSAVVCLIAAVVFVFMAHYFLRGQHLVYFCWVTFLFVFSILILINFSDVFFTLLGWDGLGVVSYFLIAYYQSPVSRFSSRFTLLINRLGDCFFILLVLVWWRSVPVRSFSFSAFSSFRGFTLLLVLTFSTKSAIFPFSPWLPAAIAAPTPISSLVHSSTLVTAGLFLMVRNYPLLSRSSSCLSLLCFLGVFTSLYAGLSALVEPDLKKVVALSTLSHLGFILLALGLGQLQLAFFHLIAHAFFKSSLFIRLGSIIVASHHYQDSRVFSGWGSSHPFFGIVLLTSVGHLVGLPFLSGFYSKDLILEALFRVDLGVFLLSLIYANVLLTFSYSFRIVQMFVKSKLVTFSVVRQPLLIFTLSLFSLRVLSIFVGFFISQFTVSVALFLPSSFKFFPFVGLILRVIWYLAVRSTLTYPNSILYPLSSMLFLSPLWSNKVSSAGVSLHEGALRSVECGAFRGSLFSYPLYLATQLSLWLNLVISSSVRDLAFLLVGFLVALPLVIAAI